MACKNSICISNQLGSCEAGKELKWYFNHSCGQTSHTYNYVHLDEDTDDLVLGMLNELLLLPFLALEVVIIWLGTMGTISQVEEKETELKDGSSFFLSSFLLVWECRCAVSNILESRSGTINSCWDRTVYLLHLVYVFRTQLYHIECRLLKRPYSVGPYWCSSCVTGNDWKASQGLERAKGRSAYWCWSWQWQARYWNWTMSWCLDTLQNSSISYCVVVWS